VRLLKIPDASLQLALGNQVRSCVKKPREQIEVPSPEQLEHSLNAPLEFVLFFCLFVVFGNSLAPERLKSAALDTAALDQVFNQGIEQRVIVQPARCLPVREVERYFKSLASSLKRGFESTNPLDQMLFD
jgi:hypothetical protein